MAKTFPLCVRTGERVGLQLYLYTIKGDGGNDLCPCGVDQVVCALVVQLQILPDESHYSSFPRHSFGLCIRTQLIPLNKCINLGVIVHGYYVYTCIR